MLQRCGETGVTTADLQALLRSRLDAVEQRLRAACARSGRARSDVTLVAVTKTVGAAVAQLLPERGLLDLGENRPQELWRKAPLLPTTVRWHLIGHLQRNKIARTLPLVRCIHAVDSVRLLSSLDEECGKLQMAQEVLLEVNVSGESTKQGFAPVDVAGLAGPIAALRNVHVSGLMTMAAHELDPEQCRPTFAGLRDLRDQLRGILGMPAALPHLSMGMSNDFEVAVEEGATLVRLGSVLFEGLEG
jgi:pyridoxal phosphate enzyme (YggS family)